jgi:5-methylcytosine-specific restriction protein A
MATPTLERPWLKWYGTQRWRDRARLQLKQHPLCAACLARGIVEAANAADHIIEHRGNSKLFWLGELQSLCPACHNAKRSKGKAKPTRDVIGDDGWPLGRN